MNDHPIQGVMSTAMQSIKEMVDVNTIVGDAVQAPDGSVIIPISKVGFGFVAAGCEYGQTTTSTDAMFGGGSGGGVSIKPVGFLVVGQGQIKFMPVVPGQSSPIDKLLEYVPELIEKVNEKIQKTKESGQNKKECCKDKKESKAKEAEEKNKDQVIKPAEEE